MLYTEREKGIRREKIVVENSISNLIQPNHWVHTICWQHSKIIIVKERPWTLTLQNSTSGFSITLQSHLDDNCNLCTLKKGYSFVIG